ncbi:calcium-binding protein [Methylobacterium sp. ID0610]|uniref:calcium-binding protein n=1 Tax=Methylobacterium carpenticola TaxID=3344827 RepID=UPI0036872DBE
MALNQTGPSTTQSPYLTPLSAQVSVTSLLSAGDTVPGAQLSNGTPWRFVGVPDGTGAFDNGDGTATVLVNHEIPPTAGATRAHGSAGAFVDRLVIDKATLQVRAAGDLGTSVYTYNPARGAYVQGTTAFARLCSADLPAVSAFYDAASGLGTQARIFMNGEETGAEGRALAWIVNGPEAGRVYELPRLGNFSFENSVASPASGAKTVTIGMDDATPGELYVYVGTKQATGTEIEKAGLTNGKLYGIKVPAFALETNATAVAASGTAFTLQEMGPNGDVSAMSGAELQAESTAEGVTAFLRPEDGAWDPTNANRFYFVTTNAITSPSRLWALEFTDVTRPELGGTVKEVLRGTEGQVMFDNITVTAEGRVILQEDPGNNARLSKVWEYDPATSALTQLAEHDPARFSGLTPPFTQDEESSGILDVSTLFGGPGRQAFLFDTQAHYKNASADLVEGGQLQLMFVDRTITGTAGNDSLAGSQIADLIWGNDGDDTLRGAAGDDYLSGLAGNDSVDGGAGNDTLFGDAGDDRVDGGEGDDVLRGWYGSDTLFGSAGNDALFGQDGNDFLGAGRGNDALSGGAGNDALYGEAGEDVLFGNAGDDELIGGAGSDTFAFGRGDGQDLIRDFTIGGAERDLIAFNGGAFASFAAVQAATQQVGADAVIAYGTGDTIRLQNVQASSLTAANFSFA